MSKQLFLNVIDYLVQSVMKKMSWITEQLNTPVKMLGNYYSCVLDRELNQRQTWALVEVQAAFFLGMLPMGYSLVFRLIVLLWLVAAVKRCRRLL